MHGKVGCKKKTISANASTCEDRYMRRLPERTFWKMMSLALFCSGTGQRARKNVPNALKTVRREIAMRAISRIN